MIEHKLDNKELNELYYNVAQMDQLGNYTQLERHKLNIEDFIDSSPIRYNSVTFFGWTGSEEVDDSLNSQLDERIAKRFNVRKNEIEYCDIMDEERIHTEAMWMTKLDGSMCDEGEIWKENGNPVRIYRLKMILNEDKTV